MKNLSPESEDSPNGHLLFKPPLPAAPRLVKSILMKNLNVTLKCHGGQLTWWDGAGQGGAKQCAVYKAPCVCPTGSVLQVFDKK